MIGILAVLLLAIAGFYLGYKLYKSNKEDDETVSMYAAITMICAITGGIVLISYLLLKGSPWTVENKVIMRYILILCVAVSFIYNLGTSDKNNRSEKVGLFYFITLFFGLIHGFGFATYFKMISGGNEILPLLEFALGVEIAQIIVVAAVLILNFLFQFISRFSKRDWVLVISSIVIGVILPMLQNTWPL